MPCLLSVLMCMHVWSSSQLWDALPVPVLTNVWICSSPAPINLIDIIWNPYSKILLQFNHGARHQSWSTYMCNNPFNPVMPWSTFALTHLYAQPWLIYPTIDPDTLIQLSMFWLYDPYIMSNPVATWMYLLWHKLMHVWLYNPCLIRIDTYICLIYTECPLSWSVLVYIYICADICWMPFPWFALIYIDIYVLNIYWHI